MDSFTERYDSTIRNLDDALSALIDSGSDFELEKNGDVLVITFTDGSKFIISPNSPVNQLWVSANYEGHRFNFNESKSAWVDEKSSEEFLGYLSRLLSQRLAEEISF
ncbi:MAG: iron donor protein CyaY [Candidatus Kapaibacterium sp.]